MKSTILPPINITATAATATAAATPATRDDKDSPRLSLVRARPHPSALYAEQIAKAFTALAEIKLDNKKYLVILNKYAPYAEYIATICVSFHKAGADIDRFITMLPNLMTSFYDFSRAVNQLKKCKKDTKRNLMRLLTLASASPPYSDSFWDGIVTLQQADIEADDVMSRDIPHAQIVAKALVTLKAEDLFTADHCARVMVHTQYADKVAQGLCVLKSGGIITAENSDLLVENAARADTLARELSALKNTTLYSPANCRKLRRDDKEGSIHEEIKLLSRREPPVEERKESVVVRVRVRRRAIPVAAAVPSSASSTSAPVPIPEIVRLRIPDDEELLTPAIFDFLLRIHHPREDHEARHLGEVLRFFIKKKLDTPENLESLMTHIRHINEIHQAIFSVDRLEARLDDDIRLIFRYPECASSLLSADYFLRENKIWNEENLTYCLHFSKAANLAAKLLLMLGEAKLDTAENRHDLRAISRYDLSIMSYALGLLIKNELHSQDNFKLLLLNLDDAISVVNNLCFLKEIGLDNDGEIRRLLVENMIHSAKIYKGLLSVKKASLLGKGHDKKYVIFLLNNALHAKEIASVLFYLNQSGLDLPDARLTFLSRYADMMSFFSEALSMLLYSGMLTTENCIRLLDHISHMRSIALELSCPKFNLTQAKWNQLLEVIPRLATTFIHPSSFQAFMAKGESTKGESEEKKNQILTTSVVAHAIVVLEEKKLDTPGNLTRLFAPREFPYISHIISAFDRCFPVAPTQENFIFLVDNATCAKQLVRALVTLGGLNTPKYREWLRQSLPYAEEFADGLVELHKATMANEANLSFLRRYPPHAKQLALGLAMLSQAEVDTVEENHSLLSRCLPYALEVAEAFVILKKADADHLTNRSFVLDHMHQAVGVAKGLVSLHRAGLTDSENRNFFVNYSMETLRHGISACFWHVGFSAGETIYYSKWSINPEDNARVMALDFLSTSWLVLGMVSLKMRKGSVFEESFKKFLLYSGFLEGIAEEIVNWPGYFAQDDFEKIIDDKRIQQDIRNQCSIEKSRGMFGFFGIRHKLIDPECVPCERIEFFPNPGSVFSS